MSVLERGDRYTVIFHVPSEIASAKKSPRNCRGDVEVFDHAPKNGGRSVDVVLLPVEGGVGLDDDVFVGGLLEFVHQHGFAGLESLRDFRVDAER